MNKSMYSLILMDDLIRAVDRLAYENGTSRSNLINRILGEYFSITTPENQIAEVFGHVSRIVAQQHAMQVQPLSGGSILELKSALSFKYNPTIKYCIEMTVGQDTCTAEFRVLSRSQSGALLAHLQAFYELWMQIEHSMLCDRLPNLRLEYALEKGRFRRKLKVEWDGPTGDSKMMGEAIGVYVKAFDSALELYFKHLDNAERAIFLQIGDCYRQYLEQTPLII